MNRSPHPRIAAVALAAAVLAAACTSASRDSAAVETGDTAPASAVAPEADRVGENESDESASPSSREEALAKLSAPLVPGLPVEQIGASPKEDVPSALRQTELFLDQETLVPISDIQSGGVPPDGIPPIENPNFLTVDEVNFLVDDEPVLLVEVNDEVRAYPIQIMTWHEIVNDTIGGVPVTVSYCPLCNSAVTFDRHAGDRVLDFGVSGRLYQSAMVMYDRQTESLWTHFTGEAAVGELVGTKLDLIPTATVSWADVREAHPEALVLSRNTGFQRRYGQNPYANYDQGSRPLGGFFLGDVDAREAALTRVIGVRSGEDSVALRNTAIADAGVTAVDLGATEVTIWSKPGVSSALEGQLTSGASDVGATGVFLPVVDGQDLTFTRTADGTFVDDQTTSTWNILGQATDGPLAGMELERVEHVDTFWFAWSTYQPDSELLSP